MTGSAQLLAKDPAEPEIPRDLANAVHHSCADISHNLNGQRLGRKGRITRERILAATLALLAGPEEEPITLRAVACKASLGMSSLYNYFTDLTELLLAVLEPVMATSEEAFLGLLRERWSDEELGERCHTFILAYHNFWARHARLLHLRNRLSDQMDQRVMLQRVRSTMPIIELLGEQMRGEGPQQDEVQAKAMATVVMTGIERSVTVATDTKMRHLIGLPVNTHDTRFVAPAARLLELAIRDCRAGGDAAILGGKAVS